MVEEMASLRSAGYVDPGWDHGTAQDERKKKVSCNYCGKVVSGGIYRLKQHLARVSGEVTYCEKAPEEVYLKMKANLEGCRVSKKPKQIEYEEQAYLNFPSNDDVDEEEQIAYRNKGKQMMIDKGSLVKVGPLRSLGYVDPGWEHGDPQDARKKKVKCHYCEKIVSGGINRFKQHLARIPGEVAPCKSAPEEVYLKIKENMKWHRTGRRYRRPDSREISAFYMQQSENEDEEEEQEEDDVHVSSTDKILIGDKRSVNDSRRAFKDQNLSKRPKYETVILKSPKSQISASSKQGKMGSGRISRKDVISAICKFFYHAGVPSHAANSPYFHKMLELVGQHGQDLAGPSSSMISGRILQDEISSVKNYLVEYKASWAVTGCSILADSWRNTQGRAIINILVSCPRGMHFVCSVDATDVLEDAAFLFKLFDKVVDEMGEENIVQVITKNTPSYQTAGKMLEEKRRSLFWTPCAAHCIEQMLEDFVKIKWVAECVEKGQKITKLIYNRSWLSNLMKKEYTGGQELLRPMFTQYASTFATLQSLMDHRIGLKRLFQSNKWLSSRVSKFEEGKEVEKIVLNATFWKKMQYIRRSVDPIIEVLQKINSDENLSLSYIYNDMYNAKIAFKNNHGDDMRKYGQFWNVIDSRWSSLSHHPLCLAAYYLNPSYRYQPDFVPNPDVVRGFNACLVRLEPNNGRWISASMQVSDFGTAKADFGTDLAISTRTELNPAAWWQQHGINCLELQRIAVRILSQTCSSFGCEHNWSIYDQIYSHKHNRLAQKRLNDFIYVHYNLRLRERQLRRMSNDSIPEDSILHENLLYDWIVESEKTAFQEDEDMLCSETEQADTYENGVREYEGGNAELRKGSLEIVTVADVEPLDTHPADDAGGATDDDDGDEDINFLGDGMSD